MEVNGKIVDPETGEVLEDDAKVKTTVRFGDGQEMPLDEFHRHVDDLTQLTLFEGHKVEVVRAPVKKGEVLAVIAK